MEKWAEIRRMVKVEERSKRSMCRQFGIHRDTLVKILEHTEPPGYRQAQPRANRKIGPFLGVIDETLEGDNTIHRKQHHTARRIFDRLKHEYGYPRSRRKSVSLSYQGGKEEENHPTFSREGLAHGRPLPDDLNVIIVKRSGWVSPHGWRHGRNADCPEDKGWPTGRTFHSVHYSNRLHYSVAP